MRKILFAFAVAVLAAAGTLQAQKKEGGKAAGKREFTLVNIEYKGTKVWVPGTLIAKKGETVEITLINNTPSGVHGFAIDEFGIEKDVAGDGKAVTVSFSAGKAGLFTIYCHRHPAHIGGQLLILD